MKETGIRIVTALWAIGLPLAANASEETFDRTVAAEANGSVVISNVSGSVEVRGWDRNEVHVKGELDEDVKRVDVETGGGRTMIKVVLPGSTHNGGEAHLTVSVPRNSSVEVSAVSADVTSRGVSGTQRLNSVSGEIDAEVAGDSSSVKTVSGDLRVRGNGKPVSLRASSVSGSLDLTNFAGKLDVVTVSGSAIAQLGEASEIRGRTTSGDLEIRAQLGRGARVDVEAVSGDVTLRLGPPVGVSMEIESFSGDIHGCLAKGVERSKYGPGSRLNIRTVEDGPRVRAKTLSGDIDICDR